MVISAFLCQEEWELGRESDNIAFVLFVIMSAYELTMFKLHP